MEKIHYNLGSLTKEHIYSLEGQKLKHKKYKTKLLLSNNIIIIYDNIAPYIIPSK